MCYGVTTTYGEKQSITENDFSLPRINEKVTNNVMCYC